MRCEAIRGMVRAAKGAAHSRYGSHCGRNSQVGFPSEALRHGPSQGPSQLVSVWEGLYPSYVSAFNFLLENALGGGGIASLRMDPQGKAFAQQLLEFPVPVSRELAHSLGPRS